MIDFSTGQVIATDVWDARRDGVTGVWVVLGTRAVSGHRPDGPIWSQAASSQTRLVSAGGVLPYLKVGGAVQVVNALTGADAVGYGAGAPGSDGFAVPAVIASDGAAVVRAATLVLVTNVPAG